MQKHPGEWNNEGIAFIANGQFKEALKCYDASLEIDPNFIMALNNKKNVLRMLKRYDEALESYDKAISIDKKILNFGRTRELFTTKWKTIIRP